MNVIEFPSQTGGRLNPRANWRSQPPPISLRPPRRESLEEFLGIVTDPEFLKSVGRILAAEAFGGDPHLPFPIEIAAYRRSAYDQAGNVFDFLLETARFNHRDRQAADQQREFQRRMFARNASAAATAAMQQLLAQDKGRRSQPIDLMTFHQRKRTLRQVSRGVEPRLAANRAA